MIMRQKLLENQGKNTLLIYGSGFVISPETFHNSLSFRNPMKFLSDIRLLLIGLWLGAACFFSFAVAPSVFGVLESRELAGSVVSRTLLIVNISGLIISTILFVTTFLIQAGIKPFVLWTERILLVIMAASCTVGQFVIGLWLSYIRAQIGKPIEEIALEDPLRIQFDKLHQYSVWVLVTAMLAALIVFFVISRKSFSDVKNKKNTKNFDFSNEFIN